MNVYEMNIMNILKETTLKTQREIVNESGYSVGKVNISVRNLIEQGYLNKELEVTEKGNVLFEQRKPKQAVILAAGIGMRMVPINTEQPKGLLEVNGEALIERIIQQLHSVGIYQIKIVVGFMKEKYEYLIDQ